LDGIKQLILTDEAQVQSVSSQIGSLNRELRKLDKRVVTTVTTTPNAIGVQTLVASLTDLKNRRISLLQRFKPTDRLVIEIDAQIANSQQALDLLRHDNSATSTDNNPTVVLLFQQLEALIVQQSGLDKSLDFLRDQQRTSEERRDQLVRITPMNDQLTSRFAELKDISQSITSKRDSAVLEDMLDKGDFGNVAVAQPPTYSRLHTKPKITLYTILAIVTDLFLSAGLLFILETKRSKILTSSDIRLISSVPVLGTIPDSRAYQMVAAGQS
jgi:capsular polysaccharide biosynthesis protein